MSKQRYLTSQLQLLDHQQQDKVINKLDSNLDNLTSFINELDKYGINSDEMTNLHKDFQVIQYKLSSQREAIKGTYSQMSRMTDVHDAIDNLQSCFDELYNRGIQSQPRFEGYRAPVAMEAEETERDIQTALDQSGIAISREELSLICPITQQKMRNPVINTTCGHSYDREGVSSHIKNSRQLSIRCPVGGCTGTVAQTNLKPNHKLRALLDRAEES